MGNPHDIKRKTDENSSLDILIVKARLFSFMRNSVIFFESLREFQTASSTEGLIWKLRCMF